MLTSLEVFIITFYYLIEDSILKLVFFWEGIILFLQSFAVWKCTIDSCEYKVYTTITPYQVIDLLQQVNAIQQTFKPTNSWELCNFTVVVDFRGSMRNYFSFIYPFLPIRLELSILIKLTTKVIRFDYASPRSRVL